MPTRCSSWIGLRACRMGRFSWSTSPSLPGCSTPILLTTCCRRSISPTLCCWGLPVVTGLAAPFLCRWLRSPVGRECRLLFLALQLLRVAPEEGIHHDLPLLCPRKASPEVLHFACQKPIQQ